MWHFLFLLKWSVVERIRKGDVLGSDVNTPDFPSESGAVRSNHFMRVCVCT